MPAPTHPPSRQREPSGRGGRIFESPWFWGIFVAVAFFVPLYRSLIRKQLTPPPVLGRMRPFELIDHKGEKFSSDRVSGIVSIFSFVDPRCGERCPEELNRLDRVQKSLKGAGPTAKILTINTRPAEVTATELKTFVDGLGPTSKMWIFLTGTPDEVHSLVADNMGLGAQAQDLLALAHNGTIVLVDQAGQIRSVSTSESTPALNQIILNLAVMINTNPPAPVRPK